MKMKYEMIIFWSEEDHVFIAEVPELPGCLAHGSTYSEALEQAESAAKLWIDVATETGREIPVPRGRLRYA